jgi:hypothetical protein
MDNLKINVDKAGMILSDRCKLSFVKLEMVRDGCEKIFAWI